MATAARCSPTTRRSPTLLRSLRMHGQGSDRYDNVRIGTASRLDTIQAAILSEKLKIFPEEIVARDRIARRYAEGLGDAVIVPTVPAGIHRSGRNTPSACAPAGAMPSPPRSRPKAFRPRSIIRSRCIASRPTSITRCREGGLPVSDRLAGEVISLPMHAYLDEPTQDRIIDAVRRAVKAA